MMFVWAVCDMHTKSESEKSSKFVVFRWDVTDIGKPCVRMHVITRKKRLNILAVCVII